MQVRDAFAEFLLAQEADARSPKTMKWYREMLASGPYNLFDWLDARGRFELKAVTTSDLRQYIVWMRAQPNARTGQPRSVYTTNGVLRCLHSFFRWCSEEYQLSNPMYRVDYPKNPGPEPKAITLSTALALIRACGDDLIGTRNRAMLLFFLATGARREEVATLTMERLHLADHYATVIGKGRKARIVPFDALTADALNEWIKVREPEPFLFYNVRSRQRLTSDGVRTIVRRIADAAGITDRHNPHGWRHLFAELYHEAGGSIASLSKLLGHTSTFITASIYLNLAADAARQSYNEHDPMRRAREALEKKEPPEQTGGSTETD